MSQTANNGSAHGPRAEGRPRVLAVDDQRDSLRLVELLLQSAGFQCIPCQDGPASLAALEREPVDVVLLDVMMPGMDGFEVCRRIKADPRFSDIPVLFLTAHLAQEDKVRGLEVGGHDYLNKPVEKQELIARTRAALRVKQLQDQLKRQIDLERRLNQQRQGRLGEHWQKTLGQLAASLAHEINNPLAVALGTVQLLTLDPQIGVQGLERLRMIDSSLQRVGQKLRSLLLIAQPREFRDRIRLATLVEDVVALMNYQLVVNKVRVQTYLDRSCYWAGPPGEMARALLSVLNNAVEATASRPGATLMIRVGRQDQEFWIRVGDNGCGLSEEARCHLFESFFTTKPPPHAGIGLYLARQIVDSVGGRIQLEAKPSFGNTEFSIYLPANAET